MVIVGKYSRFISKGQSYLGLFGNQKAGYCILAARMMFFSLGSLKWQTKVVGDTLSESQFS
jgi:hypothetical protein